jgi:hypothetical protein
MNRASRNGRHRQRDMSRRSVIHARQSNYEPEDYHLAKDPSGGLTLDEFQALFSVILPDVPIPANETTWTWEEFLQEPWVAEYLNDDIAGDVFRDSVFRRYRNRIPAAVVALDFGAECFDDYVVPVITGNSDIGCVTKDHILRFSGMNGIREALHLLYRRELIIPLISGELLAPRLVLQRIPERGLGPDPL